MRYAPDASLLPIRPEPDPCDTERKESVLAPDLSDMDDFHRMVATGRLADILCRLASGRPPIKPRSRRRRRSAPTS